MQGSPEREGLGMRHRLRIILSIAGLVCNIAATALAAAAIYVNQTTATTLATTTWGSNDFFKEALLAQSKYAILCVMALSFGTALQAAAELVRDHRRPAHEHAAAPVAATPGLAALEDSEHHRHRHHHRHHDTD
jgi:hypothetical protein